MNPATFALWLAEGAVALIVASLVLIIVVAFLRGAVDQWKGRA